MFPTCKLLWLFCSIWIYLNYQKVELQAMLVINVISTTMKGDIISQICRQFVRVYPLLWCLYIRPIILRALVFFSFGISSPTSNGLLAPSGSFLVIRVCTWYIIDSNGFQKNAKPSLHTYALKENNKYLLLLPSSCVYISLMYTMCLKPQLTLQGHMLSWYHTQNLF